jgi:hypothetical protein
VSNPNNLQAVTDKIIETDVARLELDERGFLCITLVDTGMEFNEAEANRQIAAAHALTDGEPYRILVDTTNSTNTPSVEAKKVIADVNLKMKEAVIVNSLGNRILGNIYLKMINLKYPSKIFNDRETAIAWLMED